MAIGRNEWLTLVREELEFLDDSAKRIPSRLDESARWIARRIQIEIAKEELPRLGAAVQADSDNGALTGPSATMFVRDLESALGEPAAGGPHTRELADAAAAELFRRNPISSEQIADDFGSDLSTRVLSRAALVAASIGAGTQGGLGPLKPVLGGARKALKVVYSFAIGVTRSTRATAVLIALLVSLSAAALAMAMTDLVTSHGKVHVVGLWFAGVFYVSAWLYSILRARTLPRTSRQGLAIALLLLIADAWFAMLLLVARDGQSAGRKLATVLIITLTAGMIVSVIEGWVQALARSGALRSAIGLAGVALVVLAIGTLIVPHANVPANTGARCASVLDVIRGKHDRLVPVVTTTRPAPTSTTTQPTTTQQPTTATTTTVVSPQVAKFCRYVRLDGPVDLLGMLSIILGVALAVIAWRAKPAPSTLEKSPRR